MSRLQNGQFLSPRVFMSLLLPQLWNGAQHNVLLVFEMGYVRLFQRALDAFFCTTIKSQELVFCFVKCGNVLTPGG